MNDKELAEYLKEALTVINKLQRTLAIAHLEANRPFFLDINKTCYVDNFSKPFDGEFIVRHPYQEMPAYELCNHFKEVNFNLKKLFEEMSKSDYLGYYHIPDLPHLEFEENNDPKKTKRMAKYALDDFREYISKLEFNSNF